MPTPTPTWSEWPPSRVVTLWQAAALIQDIDPDAIDYHADRTPLGVTGHARVGFLTRVKNLIHLANDPQNFESSTGVNADDPAMREVLLHDLYEFVCTSTGWRQPTEMQAIALEQNMIDKIVVEDSPARRRTDDMIAGAIVAFAGFLTSRPERLVLSASDNAGPMVRVVEEFFTLQGFAPDVKPDVDNWNQWLQKNQGPEYPT